MISKNINYDELKKTIDLLKPNEQLFEVRIIKKELYKNEVREKVLSGYFTSFDSLKNALHDYEEPANINFFMTLNSIHPACYSRLQRDRFLKTKPTTSDSDITNYDWLLIDLDPVRPSDVSSTNDEVTKAKYKADEVQLWMRANGCSEPIIALSGNGIHMLYKIDISNELKNKKSELFIGNVLKVIANKFNDDFVKIDTTVCNPSRVFKLYGTYARKGYSSEDHPHRLSKIIEMPKNIDYTEIEALQDISEQLNHYGSYKYV